MKIDKPIKIAIGVSVFVTIAVCGQLYSRREAVENQRAFDQSEIKGIISKLRHNKSSSFSLENDKTKYYFQPVFPDWGQRHYFYSFAEEGDSIYKAKFSDTLFLYKRGKAYKYTFKESDTNF